MPNDDGVPGNAGNEKLHPFDHEELAAAAERAFNSGQWMGVVFHVDDGKVHAAVTTNKFPQVEFELCQTLLADNLVKVREYNIIAGGASSPLEAGGATPPLPPPSAGNRGEDAGNAYAETEDEAEEMAEEMAEDVENESRLPGMEFPQESMRTMRRKRR